MEEDYGKLRVTAVLPNGRCRYDPTSKARLVEACLEPGASVARLALDHGVNANLLRKWVKHRKDQLSALSGATTTSPFIPVRIDKAGQAIDHDPGVSTAKQKWAKGQRKMLPLWGWDNQLPDERQHPGGRACHIAGGCPDALAR